MSEQEWGHTEVALVAGEIAGTGMGFALRQSAPLARHGGPDNVNWNTSSATLRGLRRRGLIGERPSKNLTAFGAAVKQALLA